MRGSTAFPWLLPLLALACSSSLGSEGLDIPPEGVTAPIPCAKAGDPRPSDACPESANVAAGTAKALVDALLPVASAAYGSGTRWAGTIQGSDVRRDGKPSGAAASGWVTAFCDPSSALWFDVTAGVCAARNLCDCKAEGTCGGAACEDANDRPFPTVDSDRAITAAFADDPGTATYDLSFDVRAGQWLVTRRSDAVLKKVDGTTGAIVP